MLVETSDDYIPVPPLRISPEEAAKLKADYRAKTEAALMEKIRKDPEVGMVYARAALDSLKATLSPADIERLEAEFTVRYGHLVK